MPLWVVLYPFPSLAYLLHQFAGVGFGDVSSLAVPSAFRNSFPARAFLPFMETQLASTCDDGRESQYYIPWRKNK